MNLLATFSKLRRNARSAADRLRFWEQPRLSLQPARPRFEVEWPGFREDQPPLYAEGLQIGVRASGVSGRDFSIERLFGPPAIVEAFFAAFANLKQQPWLRFIAWGEEGDGAPVAETTLYSFEDVVVIDAEAGESEGAVAVNGRVQFVGRDATRLVSTPLGTDSIPAEVCRIACRASRRA